MDKQQERSLRWMDVDGKWGLFDVSQKREWVGLTEDEFESILEQHNEAFSFVVYQSIEAKLKEKNCG